MFIYLKGEKAATQSQHMLMVAPGALVKGEEIPKEWLDENGKPVTIPITFHFGRAEVDEQIARILVAHGIVSKSKPSFLIRALGLGQHH